jgi:hypothetical protein
MLAVEWRFGEGVSLVVVVRVGLMRFELTRRSLAVTEGQATPGRGSCRCLHCLTTARRAEGGNVTS